jgi:integral membrane protein
MYRILHLVSRIEAASYLFLLVATAMKYGASYETGVTLLGPVHGVLYLIYVVALFRWFSHMGWSFYRALGAMMLGALPLGGFLVDRWISAANQRT